MKLIQTEITPIINEFLYTDLRNQTFLSSPFHAQPELELVFILKGYGKRIIGNNVESFEAGDMVFIGSNVPHVWISDEAFYEKNLCLNSEAIVTYFNPVIFEQFFNSVKEFSAIKEMIQQSSRGIRILGNSRNIIAEKLIKLGNKTGFEKIEGFLQILHLISISKDISFIVNIENGNDYHIDSDRLIEVFKYVKEHISEQISLKDVADIACMTEQSFCRYFKNRTKKNFFQYLKDHRMIHASEILIQSKDKSISQIAFECGYNSSSHFCKIFKDYYGQSPYQYKGKIHKIQK